MKDISDPNQRKSARTVTKASPHGRRNRAPLRDRYRSHLVARMLVTLGVPAVVSMVLMSAGCVRDLLRGEL
jgi:hypothetical protein